MARTSWKTVAEAKEAALAVLLNNARKGRGGLPRTAAWGYPEPYTRDLLIGALGILVSGNSELVGSLRRVLKTLAANQTELGHIPSLVDVPSDRGASDTTPLFLIALALFRKVTGEKTFLAPGGRKAHRWMCHQSPEDDVLVAQQPTSDWRDEQWVQGAGLFVNTLVFSYLKLVGEEERAQLLARQMRRRFDVRATDQRYIHDHLARVDKPYFVLWAYKIDNSERFDLLGNCLAILSGIASPARSRKIVGWIEAECRAARQQGLLALDLAPCLLPYIRPGDPDFRPRYAKYNRPGRYHNGGIWPFVCGFHVAALVAAGRMRLAQRKLLALAELVRFSREANVRYGFNEWFTAQDGKPRGQDWQSWSASMFLYAAECVVTGHTPFFDELRR